MTVLQLNPLISFGHLNPKVTLTKQIKQQPFHFLNPREKLKKWKNGSKEHSYTWSLAEWRPDGVAHCGSCGTSLPWSIMMMNPCCLAEVAESIQSPEMHAALVSVWVYAGNGNQAYTVCH